MADLIRVGKRLINLDNVAYIDLDAGDDHTVVVAFNAASEIRPAEDDEDDPDAPASLPELYCEFFQDAEAQALRRYFGDWRRFPNLMPGAEDEQ